MRRFSEVPITPTPFPKINNNIDLKIGSTLHIPNTGKAILRYVGTIEGKSGRYAGIELLGESVSLGKNSGDVNGVEYFKTVQPGAGLFMTYDKLISSIDYAESPRTKRHSLATGSPAIRLYQTPSRAPIRNSQSPKLPYATVRKTSISQTNPVTSPPHQTSTQGNNIKSPPTEREIQRLKSSKIIVENERDALVQQNSNLRREIEQLTIKINENDLLIKNLQKAQDELRQTHEKSLERVSIAESKLIRQRRIYEDQRKELLEVIDQVEAQVNDNEQLYITELKKLQEELTQKQDIIEDLHQKQKNLQDLYEKQKSSVDESGNKQIDQLQNEISNLQLTNLTQMKAIEQLRVELKQKEETIVDLNKGSLALKETHISENEQLSIQVKKHKSKIEDLSSTIDIKDQDILRLNGELDSLKTRIFDSDFSKDSIDASKTQIEALQKEVDKSTALEDEIKKLLNNIEMLKEEKESFRSNDTKNNDKLQELEFKLEGKEKIIEDLKLQITETQEKQRDNQDSSIQAESESLKQKITEKEGKIHTLEKQIHELNEKFKSHEALVKENQFKLEQYTQIEKDLDLSQSELKARESKIHSLEEQLNSIKEVNLDIIKLKDEIDIVRREKKELQDKISIRDLEIEKLNTSIRSLEVSKEEQETKDTQFETEDHHKKSMNSEDEDDDDTSTLDNSIVEEKNIEIELLKEELLQLKSTDHIKEMETLKTELKRSKTFNSSSTNTELNHQIHLLQQELDQRPTLAEMNELRSELELIDELRKIESKSKDKEIYTLKESLKRYETPKRELRTIESKESMKRGSTATITRTSMSNMSLNRPPVISQVVDGALQIYVPDKKDPTNGRQLWCGLCEREGHDSIDCPYENDIF